MSKLLIVVVVIVVCQIVYMGWTEEREQDSLQDRMYTPKFLALRGSSLYKFISPPVSIITMHCLPTKCVAVCNDLDRNIL